MPHKPPSDDELKRWAEIIEDIVLNRTVGSLSLDKCTRLIAEVRRLREIIKRPFPIMKGPSVPWFAIAPHEDWAQTNHGQTLKELARRGGLDPTEAYCVVNGVRYRDAKKDVGIKGMLEWWTAFAERMNRP